MIHVLGKHMLNFFFASSQTPLPVLRRFGELITRWTTEGFEKSVEIGDMANLAITSKRPYCFRVFPLTPARKFANRWSVYNVNVVQKMSAWTISSTTAISSTQTPWKFAWSVKPVSLRNRLNNLAVSSSSLSFPCKCNAKALKTRTLSFYSIRVLSSNVKQLTKWFVNSGFGNTVFCGPWEPLWVMLQKL